ncbi:hypothetical protein, partial [Klebsiella pneumoniae]|uniref:hypothetical protein n=1 Tax=Klebsiella pneumoniae TaxID=573 RepID=UPI001372E1D6
MKGGKIKRKIKFCPRIRWGYLKDANINIFKNKMLDHKIWIMHEEANIMWENVASAIKKIAKDVLGESKGKASNNKNSWWWNQDVQEKIQNKKLCYKSWYNHKSLENWEKYKVACRNSKKAVCD